MRCGGVPRREGIECQDREDGVDHWHIEKTTDEALSYHLSRTHLSGSERAQLNGKQGQNIRKTRRHAHSHALVKRFRTSKCCALSLIWNSRAYNILRMFVYSFPPITFEWIVSAHCSRQTLSRIWSHFPSCHCVWHLQTLRMVKDEIDSTKTSRCVWVMFNTPREELLPFWQFPK